jgi:hypothetical protein
MPYIENPKTKGSGIVCCIPQTGRCPNQCPECFFQNGRSYLEPLETNLPNMPDSEAVNQVGQVVRVNDGNDSNVDKDCVLLTTERYRHRFFNTAIPDLSFPDPVVLTVNPGRLCDERFFTLSDCKTADNKPPANLMFVRLLVSPFNTELVAQAIQHWTDWVVPVVLTFMAYHKEPGDPQGRDWTGESWVGPGPRPLCAEQIGWVERRRTTNTYWAVDAETWASIMYDYRKNDLVYSCGEGMNGSIKCRQCGNCLREYFATKERIHAT